MGSVLEQVRHGFRARTGRMSSMLEQVGWLPC